MIIISKRAINDFSEGEANSTDALLKWYYDTKLADWGNFSDMKKTFNSVDAIGNDLYIFNIKGNYYRLIARIFFSVRTVYIVFIGTHKAYDQINVKDL